MKVQKFLLSLMAVVVVCSFLVNAHAQESNPEWILAAITHNIDKADKAQEHTPGLKIALDGPRVSVPAIYISTYDTEDPLEVGHQTVYVIETRNEGTAPCTNVQLENTIPEQMVFISASPNPLEVQGRKIVFPKVKILQPGDKLTYKVVCKGIKKGAAKNVAVIRYSEFHGPVTDVEGTSVYGSVAPSSAAGEIKKFPKDANSEIRQLAAGAKVEDKAKEQPKVTSVTRMEARRLERIKKSLEENLPKLRSSDPKERAKAARDLAFDGAESALPELAKLLKDPHPDPRGSAIGAIGDLGGQAYVDQIAALLRDSDAGVKQYAIGALQDLGAKRYASEIASLLNDPTWETRGVALYALGDLGASKFIPKIAKHLGARRCGEAGGAVVALSQLGARQYGERMIGIVRRYPDCGSTFLRAFGDLGDRSYVGDLAPYLRTGKNDSIKAEAALALAHLGARHYEDKIAGLLNGRGFAGGKAALALGILGSKKHADAVAKLAVGKYRSDSYATQALGMMGAEEHADAAAAVLRKSDYNTACAAIWALGRLKSTRHAGIVAAFLEYKGSCRIYDLDTHWFEKRRVDKLAKEALLRMSLDPAKVEVEDPMPRRRSRYTRRASSRSTSSPQDKKSPLAAVPTNTSQTNMSMDDTCVDVSRTHWAYSSIQKTLPIMQLCTPASEHKFNGSKLVNRYDMARFIVGLMDRWDLKPKGVLDPEPFLDVPKSHPDYEAVQIVVSTGILQGFDGKFHGDKLVNRYQMSVILNRLLEKNGIPAPSPVSEHTFKDVGRTHWAYKAVQDMVSRGILQGFDGKFHGDKLVNRYQMAVIIKKVQRQSPLKQAS